MSYEIDESRTSRYGVDLIGQLDANLALLRGYGVMALELIQNADDAHATEISIDITDKALIVRNDAEFSSCADRQNDFCLRGDVNSGEMCDWHAFVLISSGAKSERSVTTTGRFGLGFTSVFQITDNPEVESAGSKLIIKPDQDSSSWKQTSLKFGTVFTLPWAFDEKAPVRKRLKNAGVVTRESLSEILTKINETSAESLVFLKNLTKISILNNGRVKSVYTREYIASRNLLNITHQPSNKIKEYYYVSADFTNALNFLEVKFPRDLGEKKRRRSVEIAIPKEFDTSKSGLIYAYLPTERNTLMPMSINGDFYPNPSRKDVILDRRSGSDAFSEWNRTIIECSADLLNSHLEEIYLFLGYRNFWKLIQTFFDLNEQIDSYGSDTSDCFNAFWNKFKLQSETIPIVPIEGNEEISKSIADSYLLEGEDIKEKRQAVKLLGINSPSHKIQKQFPILRALGIEDIDFNVIVAALAKAHWVNNPREKVLPNDPEIKERYVPIYTLIDSYIPKETSSVIFRDSLLKYRLMPILISHSRSLVAPRDLSFTEISEIQNLAVKLNPKTSFLDEDLMKFTRVKSSCHEFSTEDAVHLIEWILGKEQVPNFPTVKLIHSLLILIITGKKPSEDDVKNLQKLKIWPTTDGTLISAEDGMIVGDFSDPLGSAEIIDISKLDNRIPAFLKEVLKVKILSLESYIEEILPNIFSFTFNNIDVKSYQKLLAELSKHHKKFENRELVSQMQSLLLIPTETGNFLKIADCAVGSNSEKERLRGIFENWFAPKYFPESKMDQQFLETLGLRASPNTKSLEKSLRNLISENQNLTNRQKAIRIVDYLVDKKSSYQESEISSFFSSFSSVGFMPAKGDFEYWYSPEDLLSPEVEEMVKSQNHLKILDLCEVNIALIDHFIQKTKVNTEPELSDVIAHVLVCADSKLDIPNRVLKYLNRVASKKNDDWTLENLRSLREVSFLKTPGGFVRPADLYKALSKIGEPWAYLLPKNLDFPDLIDALGIKQTPDGDDLIRILNQIKTSHFDSGDLNLSPNRLAAYLQCWELLNSLCIQDVVDDIQLDQLRNSDLFLNGRNEFEYLENLVIADSEWFRTEFETEFGSFFVLDDHVYSDILHKLEFRYLSQNIKANLLEVIEPVNRNEVLEQEISLRAGNIAAVLSKMESLTQSSNSWTDLDVYQVKSIHVEWALRFEDQDISVTKPGNVYADLVNRKLYITEYLNEEDEPFNWEVMFRELFDQLFPAESKQSLVGTVAIVSALMNKSPKRGFQYLQDIGISISERATSVDFSKANVKEVELNLSDEGTSDSGYTELSESEISDSDKTEYSQSVRNDDSYSTPTDSQLSTNSGIREIQNYQTEENSKRGDELEVVKPDDVSLTGLRSSQHHDRTQSAQPEDSHSRHSNGARAPRNDMDRPRSVDRSKNFNRQYQEIREAYIYVEKEPSDDAVDAQKQKMESESQSRKIVIEHERAEGRETEEMPANNPGYDVESTESNGDIRYIEIKSTKSLWGRDGITLSFAQLNLAYIKKDAFWLYVIENIGSENSRIYKIQNPMKHLRGFKLNDSWKEIAVSLELAADNKEFFENGIGKEDVGTRILHVERGECFLIGWEQIGASVKVTLLFDDIDEHVVLPLNFTKMKKLGA